MPYATRADLKLAFRATTLATIAGPLQDEALLGASSEADSSLTDRYTLPLVGTVPAVLRQHVAAKAAVRLLGAAETTEVEQKTILAAGARADAWFEAVRENKIHPVVTDSSPNQRPAAPAVFSLPLRGW